MPVDAMPARRWRTAVTEGLVCGAITAGALAGVLGLLAGYQVADYADQDFQIGLAGSLIAGIGAAAVIATVRARPRREENRLPRAHVIVPLLLPVVVVPLVAGLERDRLEAALIWGAAAILTHLLIGAPRRAAIAGIALTCAAAIAVTAACQHRWRAQKFEAVGLPLYVAEVPGYRLSGTWAGRYSVIMMLESESSRHHHVDVWVTDGDHRCRPGATDRWVVRHEGVPDSLGICLPDGEGAALVVGPGYRAPDISSLFPRITVHRVDASALADHPDDGTEREPD